MTCSNCGNQQSWFISLFNRNDRSLCRACAAVHSSGLARYRTEVDKALGNGSIEATEIQGLGQIAKEGLLSEAERNQIHLAAYQQVYNKTIADRSLTVEEERQLSQIQSELGVPGDSVAHELSTLARLKLIREAQEGRLPVLRESPILLKHGELPHFVTDADLLEERVVDRGYVGGSQGVSIRIMRGVSYRIGGHRGHLVSKTDIIKVDHGKVVITNKRVAFAGLRASFSVPYGKILNFNVFQDGIQLNREGKTKPQVLVPPDVELMASILAGAANQFAGKDSVDE